MTKIVISTCYGGFGLSPEAMIELVERSADNIRTSPFSEWTFKTEKDLKPIRDGYSSLGFYSSIIVKDGTVYSFDDYEHAARTNKDLIEVVEELGTEKASGRFAHLKVVEIPDSAEWVIEEYDGAEWVAEQHRTWS